MSSPDDAAHGWIEDAGGAAQLSPGIPVILSSSYDEARVMASEDSERPNAFLGKPYQLKELRDTINRVFCRFLMKRYARTPESEFDQSKYHANYS
ncbi:MAG: hypothetical protein V1844_25645 [Pseudomonadota bacterium]